MYLRWSQAPPLRWNQARLRVATHRLCQVVVQVVVQVLCQALFQVWYQVLNLPGFPAQFPVRYQVKALVRILHFYPHWNLLAPHLRHRAGSHPYLLPTAQVFFLQECLLMLQVMFRVHCHPMDLVSTVARRHRVYRVQNQAYSRLQHQVVCLQQLQVNFHRGYPVTSLPQIQVLRLQTSRVQHLPLPLALLQV